MATQHAFDTKASRVCAALKAVAVLALCAVPASVRAEPSAGQAQEDHGSSQSELGARAVISVTPVLGVGVAQHRLPNNVQLLGGQTLDDQRSIGVQDALHARSASVTINDVQVRGFSASPLLGTPQGIAVYQSGVRGNDVLVGGAAYQTALNAQTAYLGVYATDTFSVSERLHLTLSGRLNRARIALHDLQGTELDGVHDYTRVNPAAGLVYQALPQLTLYGGYSEANRVPSAAELACADPNVPCRVPNAFLSDPALKQVVSRALEFGLRGRQRWGQKRLRWSLAAFGSRNQDDILFVAGARIGTGYFRNAGQTQRLGIEANAESRIGVLDLFGSYQLLRASFESALSLPGDNHPRARVLGDGRRVIDVEPGDRVPGLPEHGIKVGFSVEVIDDLRLGSDARYSSAQYLRGDEANLLAPLDGSFVLDAHASYRVLPWLMFFVDAENLIDTAYETFGVLGEGQGVLPFASDPRFLGPGAPLGVWLGAEITL